MGKNEKNRLNIIKTNLLRLISKYNSLRQINNFNFQLFSDRIENYTFKLHDNNDVRFKFTSNSIIPDLYSTTYAIMLLGLVDKIDNLDKNNIIEHINQFQSEDGFFRESILQSELSEIAHHWGWHHLIPHIIIAYDYLNATPKYDFIDVIETFNNQSISSWLSKLDWTEKYLYTSNIIMNIGVALQYSRDYFQNKKSASLIKEMKKWLIENIFENDYFFKKIKNNDSKLVRSTVIKALYHIVPIFYFDNEIDLLPTNRILINTIRTQNNSGSFGLSKYGDACEDIDSIYLITLLDKEKKYKDIVINFFNYVFLNQNIDNGFVFKRNLDFQYADQKILSSGVNESNLFATWFRTLSVAFACEYLEVPHFFKFTRVPGYQYF